MSVDIVSQNSVQQQAGKEPEAKSEPAQERHHWYNDINVQGINKPWIFIFIPLLAGAIWLVNNTWVIIDNIDKPYMLLAGPATIGSAVAVWLIFSFFKLIIAGLKSFWQTFVTYAKQPGSVFWIATTIFLLVSMMESGTCFGLLLGDALLQRGIGYAVALAIDSVNVVCILAYQGAARRNDTLGKLLYMVGIIACASLSTIANGYMAHERLAGKTLSSWDILGFVLQIAPPLFVVFLGFASEYIAGQTSSKIDPASFEQAENDRMRFREIQRDMLLRSMVIKQQVRTLSMKPHRRFFLFNLLFPITQQSLDENEQLERTLAQLSEQFKQIQDSRRQLPAQNTTANTESIQSSVDVIKSDDSPANTLVIIDELPAVQESNNWEIKQSINESITPVNTLVVEPVSGRLNTSSNSEVSKAVNTPVLSHDNTEVDTQLNTTPNSESSNAVNTPVNTLVDTVVLNPVSNQADTEVSTPVNTPTNTDVNTHSDTPIVRDELDEYWSKVIAKYPAVIEWRSSGLSSVSVEQIAEVSGFSHQKIGRAKLASFNGGKKRIKSVLHWLSHQSPIKHVNSPVDTQVSRSLMNELNTEVITAVDTDVLELVSNPVDTSVNTGVDTEVLGGVNTPSDTDVEEEEISQELEPVIDPSDSDSTESIEQVDTDELPALDSEELDDQIVIAEENQPEVKPQVTRPLSLDDSSEELKEKDPVTDPEIVAIGD